MRSFPIGLAALSLAVLGSCASRPTAAPPPAAPRPAPVRPAPSPEPAPPPAPAHWADSALSPGDWTYSDAGSSSSAAFGPPWQPSFIIRCEPSRQVSLSRTGAAASTAITVRTSSAARTLAARSSAVALSAILAASDPFLDAIVFSRGRFSVETAGLPALIVPAWPEPARVVEDCRS